MKIKLLVMIVLLCFAGNVFGETAPAEGEALTPTLQAPKIILPGNDAKDMSIRASFEWEKIDTCDYIIQLDTSLAFNDSSSVIAKIRGEEQIDKIQLTLARQYLQYNTKYYWRVKAFNSKETGYWSEVRTLSTEDSEFSKTVAYAFDRITDNDGITTTIIGYSIVFIALVALFLFINYLAKLLTLNQRKKLKAEGHIAADNEDLNISGEINAAIFMAMHLHFQELHDYESAVLTFKKEPRKYSPWSSKIYNISPLPDKRG